MVGNKRKVLIRLPREVTDKDTGRRIVLNELERYYVQAGQDFHMNGAMVKASDLDSKGVFSVGKDSFVCFDACFIDDYLHIRRNAQIITLKDLGHMISFTGMNRDSVVLSAGAGSGAVGCFLGNIVKRVDELDINEDNISVARGNYEALGVDNVHVAKADVYDEGCVVGREHSYDVFVLDVPEPWRALGVASKALKVGGFLVVYCPNISQVQEAVKALPGDMLVEKTIEIIEREWSVKDRVLRPVTKDFGHTAFMSFIRKIS